MNNNQNINDMNANNNIPVSSPVPQNPINQNASNVQSNSINNQSSNQFINTNAFQPNVISQNGIPLPTNNQEVSQNVVSNQQVQQMQTYNESSINDLNVDGSYNRLNVPPEYVNDVKVKENIEAPKKNTVPISKELKTVIVIALILLVFILVMPFLFDLISNLRFH